MGAHSEAMANFEAVDKQKIMPRLEMERMPQVE